MKRYSKAMASAFALHKIIRDESGIPTACRFTEVNSDFEAMTGLAAADIVGRTVKEVFPNTEERWIQDYDRVAETGEPMEIEAYSVAWDKYLRVHVFRPAPDQLAVFFSDISERKQKEQQLKLTQFAMDHHTDAAFWANEAGEFVYFNHAGHENLGYSEEELCSMAVWDIDPNVTPANWHDTVEECKHGRGVSQKSLHRRKDGSLFPVEINGHYIEFADSRLVCGLIHDISERERAEQASQESNQRYDIAISAAKLGVWERDIDSGRLKWNDQMYAIYGIRPEEFTGSYEAWKQCIHPDDLAQATAEAAAAERGQKEFNTEFRIIRPDSEIRHIRAFSKITRAKDGRPLRMIGINQDITRQIQTEERFRMLFANMLIGGAIYDPVDDGHDFVFADINKAGLTQSKIQIESVIGRRVTEVFPGIKEMGLFETFKRVWRTGEPEELPTALYQDDRINQWLENYIFKLPNGQLVAIYHDISERKQAEEALRENKTYLDSIINQSPFPMWIADLDGTIIRTNKALCSALNLDADQLEGKYNILKDGNFKQEGRLDEVKAVFEGQKTIHFSMSWKAKHVGHLELTGARDVHIEASMIPVLNESGNLTQVICQWLDITNQKKVEEDLKKSEERFRSTVNDLQVGVVLHAPDTSITLCNPAAALMLGVDAEEAIGKINTDPAWNFVYEGKAKMPAEDFPVNQVLATGKAVSNKVFGIMRPGDEEPIWCKIIAVPIFNEEKQIQHIIVNFMDISELKRVELNLIARNIELERFNKAAVGRELRMIELKEEINALSRALGRTAPYMPRE